MMYNLYFKNILNEEISKYLESNNNCDKNYNNFDNNFDNNYNNFFKFSEKYKRDYSEYYEKNNITEKILKEDFIEKCINHSIDIRTILNIISSYNRNKVIIRNVLEFFTETILSSVNYFEFFMQLKILYKSDLSLLYIFIIQNTVYKCLKITWQFKKLIYRKWLNYIKHTRIISNEYNLNTEKLEEFINNENKISNNFMNENKIIYIYEKVERISFKKPLKCWWFSSNELIRILKIGLTNQNFMFPNPYIFKNPYSNIELNLIDCINVYNCIIKNEFKSNQQIPSWLYLLRTAKFDIIEYSHIASNILDPLCTEIYVDTLDPDDFVEELFDAFSEHNMVHLICKKCLRHNYKKISKLFKSSLIKYLLYVNNDSPYYKNEFIKSKIVIANIIRNNMWIVEDHVLME